MRGPLHVSRLFVQTTSQLWGLAGARSQVQMQRHNLLGALYNFALAFRKMA